MASFGRRSELTLGLDLYQGHAPLQARLPGHRDALPPLAVRCINCHAGAGTAVPDQAPSFGGPLDAASLTSLRSRRQGPQTRFDARSLCRLLRTGVDPANILLPGTMPRYELSDQACESLWSYLVSR